MASSSGSGDNSKLPPLEKLPEAEIEPTPVYKEVWVFVLLLIIVFVKLACVFMKMACHPHTSYKV